MELKKFHWIGISLGLAVIILAVILNNSEYLFFLIGVGIIIGFAPFIFSIISESRIATQKEEMFLEFARNLVESVKTGVPISKSIVNLKNRDYGMLTVNVQKLANQISMGIPLNFALEIFAKDVDNKSVSRAITLIGQAEKAGGNIEEILESVAGAVNTADKLKKERKSAISTLVVQGYIIFFIFMIIILVMQFQIIPLVGSISVVGGDLNIGVGGQINQLAVSRSFLYLLLIQGFFSGLTIGKLAEGTIKSGIKHSFALMLVSFVVSAGASLFFG